MFLLYWRLLFIHKLTCGRHHDNLLYHSSFSIYSANKSTISLEDKPEHSLFWKEETWGQWKCKVFNLLLPSPLVSNVFLCPGLFLKVFSGFLHWQEVFTIPSQHPETNLRQLGPLVVMSSLFPRALLSVSAEGSYSFCVSPLCQDLFFTPEISSPRSCSTALGKAQFPPPSQRCPLSTATLLSAVSWKEHNVY